MSGRVSGGKLLLFLAAFLIACYFFSFWAIVGGIVVLLMIDLKER